MAKNILHKFAQHAEEEQWTSAMAILGRKKSLERLDCSRDEIRTLIRLVCEGYREKNDMNDAHFPQVMVRAMERCNQHEWLMQFAEERFAIGDYSTSLKGYTAARLPKAPDLNADERKAAVQAALIAKARELCTLGMPLNAFDFVYAADSTALSYTPDLREQLTQVALRYWERLIQEVETVTQYEARGLPKIQQILHAAEEPGLLFRTCAPDIRMHVAQEVEQALEGNYSAQKSWQTVYDAMLKRVLETHTGNDALNEQELTCIGDHFARRWNVYIAATAYSKAGNMDALEALAYRALSHNPLKYSTTCIGYLHMVASERPVPDAATHIHNAITQLLMRLPAEVPKQSHKYQAVHARRNEIITTVEALSYALTKLDQSMPEQ